MPRSGLNRATRYRAYTLYSRRGRRHFGRFLGYALVVALLVVPAVIFSRTDERPLAAIWRAPEPVTEPIVDVLEPPAAEARLVEAPVVEQVPAAAGKPAGTVIERALPPSLSSAPAAPEPRARAQASPTTREASVSKPRVEAGLRPAAATSGPAIRKSASSRSATASRSESRAVRKTSRPGPQTTPVPLHESDPPPMRRPM